MKVKGKTVGWERKSRRAAEKRSDDGDGGGDGMRWRMIGIMNDSFINKKRGFS